MKIRAEDSRSVAGVDISGMIGDLPGGRSTQNFSTPNASGSTSQAANIAEALEIGTSLLLVDEDTSATNFMIRDERMRELVRKEPISPFIDLVRPLYESLGVSPIVVGVVVFGSAPCEQGLQVADHLDRGGAVCDVRRWPAFVGLDEVALEVPDAVVALLHLSRERRGIILGVDP